jgi:hypothetical protein
MYFFVLLVCLQGAPQCVPLVQDPPVFYESEHECKFHMINLGELIAKDLSDDNQVGRINGDCFKDESVKPA